MILRIYSPAAVCALGVFLTAAPLFLRAQVAGPMQPPESAGLPAPSLSRPEPPSLPPDEIIRRFAAKEDEMVRAILGYSFQESVRLEEIGPDGRPAGQFETVMQMHFGPDGRLYEKPVRRQPSTLHYLDIERGESDLLAPTPLFPLTTSQLPKYEITYGGKQPLDELSAYYFTVKPRTLDRAHAYFSGVVWVDVQDLVIVKTMGKWVTETGDVTSSTLPFTVFETYRQQIGKNFWFPAYSRSDETYAADKTQVPIRIIVRWTNFAPANAVPSGDSPGAMKSPDNN